MWVLGVYLGMETLKSVDGYNIKAGDIIYVKHDDGTLERKVVKWIAPSGKKLTYTEPCSQGYIGARYNRVYKDSVEDFLYMLRENETICHEG